MFKHLTLLKNYTGIILFLISLISCTQTDKKDNEIVTANYSIKVPKELERTYNLNELAEVQFQKVDEDLYFIVLEQTKESFKNAIKSKIYKTEPSLFGYFEVVTSHFDEINKNFEVKDFGQTKINSCNAIVFSMYGERLDDGKKAFYRYALIEDDKNLYQIMSWTNIRSKDKLTGKMNGIINSFKSNSNSQ